PLTKPGVFDRLVNLKELRLYSNQLTTLPAGLFDSLTQLTILALERNQLQAQSEPVFDSAFPSVSLSLGSLG
ncbi:unnamed protein product, partial [Lampetra planeri]